MLELGRVVPIVPIKWVILAMTQEIPWLIGSTLLRGDVQRSGGEPVLFHPVKDRLSLLSEEEFPP